MARCRWRAEERLRADRRQRVSAPGRSVAQMPRQQKVLLWRERLAGSSSRVIAHLVEAVAQGFLNVNRSLLARFHESAFPFKLVCNLVGNSPCVRTDEKVLRDFCSPAVSP